MQPLQNCIGPTIRIGREILCLPYAGFFFNDITQTFVFCFLLYCYIITVTLDFSTFLQKVYFLMYFKSIRKTFVCKLYFSFFFFIIGKRARGGNKVFLERVVIGHNISGF